LSNTKIRTATIRSKIQKMPSESCYRLTRQNHFEYIRRSSVRVPAIAPQHDRQTLAATLHAPQRHLNPHVFIDIKRRLQISPDAPRRSRLPRTITRSN
jgi:hypothetical protein